MLGSSVWLTLRKGMMLSLAMACRRRGAPVSDWRPAPQVEKKEPITMTHGDGHDRVPTTRYPFTESPNLNTHSRARDQEHTHIHTQQPKSSERHTHKEMHTHTYLQMHTNTHTHPTHWKFR